MPDGTVDALLADPTGDLTQILLYHVLGAEVLSTDLSDGQVATTINGQDVTVSINNGVVQINDAEVTMVDLITDNGVVHVIDAVLLPNLSSNKEIVLTERITVYPNPTADFIQFKGEGLTNENMLEILDMTGRVVLKSNYLDLTNQVDVSDLVVGKYIVQIKNEERILVQSFIKN